MIGLLFMLFYIFVMESPLAAAWFNKGYWWLFILPPIAFILMVTAVACFIRKKEDKITLQRNLSLQRALGDAQDSYLSGTGIELTAGDYGSWIEVSYNSY